MNPGLFWDYPRRVDPRLYDEAVMRFARAISPRVIALYQTGNVTYPGLSDIDLIAVVDRASWDNDQFFSPFVRLPRYLRRLFRHGPQIIPEQAVEAIGYASCSHATKASAAVGSRRRLVLGSDVLGERTADVTPAWRACQVAEGMVMYRTALDRVSAPHPISVSRLVARAVSLRYPVSHLNVLTKARDLPDYTSIIDAQRTVLSDVRATSAERHRAAVETLDTFAMGLRAFERRAREMFQIPAEADMAEHARQMLAGRLPMRGVEPAYIRTRLDEIARYIGALRALGFSRGSMFARKPNQSAVAPSRADKAVRVAIGAAYKLRHMTASL